MKKSKSDLIDLKSNCVNQEKYSSKKLFQIRLSIKTCIRSIWKISTKRTPIIFRKMYPLSTRYKIPVTTKISFGFSTNRIEDILPNTLTKQMSTCSFYTARESLSSLSSDDTEILRKIFHVNHI